MKTKVYIATLLAVIIQVMVKSQTPANLAFQADANYVLGYAHFTEAERSEFSMVQDPSELVLQSDASAAKAAQLNKEALTKKGIEKDRLLNEAAVWIKKSEVEKLAASELQAYNNRMEFQLTKSAFIQTLKKYDANDGNTIEAKRLLLNAVRSYRLAIELREEAYAQLSNAAILANLQNAEEKETKALVLLVQAKDALDQPAPMLVAAR